MTVGVKQRVSVLFLVGLASFAGSCDPPPPPASIEVLATWSGTEETNFRSVLRQFQDKTHHKFDYTSAGDDLPKVLKDRVAKGNPPDVAILPQPGLLNDLVTRKALIPIEDFAGDVVRRNYDETWRKWGSGINGTLYGVWFKASDKSTVWYRPNAFVRAGVVPPRTWEQLQATTGTLATALSGEKIAPLAVGGGSGWPLTDWFENIYLRSAGPEKYDLLACHKISWNDSSVKDALTMLGQILGRDEWVAGGRIGARATTFEKSVEQVYSDPPSAAMVNGSDFVATLLPKYRKTLGDDANFFDFPAIRGSRSSAVVGGDVAVLLKDTKPGRELMAYLATPEAATPWAGASGFVSPNKSLDLSVYRDETSLRATRVLRESEVVRYDLSDLLPASFAGTPGQGMLKILQDYVREPAPENVDATASRLEEGASVAEVGCPK